MAKRVSKRKLKQCAEKYLRDGVANDGAFAPICPFLDDELGYETKEEFCTFFEIYSWQAFGTVLRHQETYPRPYKDYDIKLIRELAICLFAEARDDVL